MVRLHVIVPREAPLLPDADLPGPRVFSGNLAVLLGSVPIFREPELAAVGESATPEARGASQI